ncbi:MAG: flavodoxin [Candidatus Bipolaricaulota bacterium]|nr:flavodoxin [Candidatus Bipolaricaulota bacterium]
MKALVMYYTRTGKTRTVAEAIAAACNGELQEIVEVGAHRKGFVGWLRAGRDAMRKQQSRIETPAKRPADYDVVFVGSPVWASNVVPAVRSYLTENQAGVRRIAPFCTMGGDNAGRTLASMRELVPAAKPVGELAIKAQAVSDPNALRDRIGRWVDEVRSAATAA